VNTRSYGIEPASAGLKEGYPTVRKLWLAAVQLLAVSGVKRSFG
jgi:hypothetical protein